MSQTFIPGWSTDVLVDLEDLTVIANSFDMTRTKGSQPKAVFGSAFRREIPGQAGGSVSLAGHVSVEKLQALEDIFNSETSVAYVFQVGIAASNVEAGAYAGFLVITEFGLTAGAEDEWDWTLSATLDGAPIFTPPTP